MDKMADNSALRPMSQGVSTDNKITVEENEQHTNSSILQPVDNEASGSISSETLSSASPTLETIHSNVEDKVEQVEQTGQTDTGKRLKIVSFIPPPQDNIGPPGQSAQLCRLIQKEQDEEGGEYILYCGCGKCKVIRIVKIEPNEPDATEYDQNENVQGRAFINGEQVTRNSAQVLPSQSKPLEGQSSNEIYIKEEFDDDHQEVIINNMQQQELSLQSPRNACISGVASSSGSINHVTGLVPISAQSQSSSQHSVQRGTVVKVEEDEKSVQVCRCAECGLHCAPQCAVKREIKSEDEEELLERPSKRQIGEEVGDGERDENESEMGQNSFLSGDEQVARDHVQVPVRSKKQYKCTFDGCDKIFKGKNPLNRHILVHSGEKHFKCSWDGCDLSFKRKDHMLQHYETHSEEKKFKCNWKGCNLAFKRKGSMQDHYKLHTPELSHICDQCGKGFKSPFRLARHTLSHAEEKSFKCDNCNLTFAREETLREHYKSHTGEKPFKCPWKGCNSAFPRKASMQCHYKLHTPESLHPCEQCGKGFQTTTTLARHALSHSGEKPFKCTWKGCEKAFSTKEKMQLHYKRHTKEYSFFCEVVGCKSKFITKGNLRQHVRSHTGECAFVCDWPDCGGKFTRKSNLDDHRLSHTNPGERLYPCKWCEKKFAWKCVLNKHYKQVHNSNA